MDFNSVYTSNVMPTKIIERHNRMTTFYVPYDIQCIDDVYHFKYACVLPDNYNYSGLIDAIIRIKYTSKDMEGIINNYLMDMDSNKYKNEFLEMQEWRKFAKMEAREHFGIQ